MWDAKKQNAVFKLLEHDTCLTIETMVEKTGITGKNVCHLARKLLERGLIERSERGCYRLTPEGLTYKETGKEIKAKSYKYEIPQHKMTFCARSWKAMRLLKRFVASEVICLAKREEKSAYSLLKAYIKVLEKTGYIVELKRGKDINGIKGNGEKRYVLIKDTGLAAPIYQSTRGCLYDPNLKEAIPC